MSLPEVYLTFTFNYCTEQNYFSLFLCIGLKLIVKAVHLCSWHLVTLFESLLSRTISLRSSSGYHSISQTDALCREQEGNGGLDHCTQISPEMGNL